MSSHSFSFYILMRTLNSSELMPSLLTNQQANHRVLCSTKPLHSSLGFQEDSLFCSLSQRIESQESGGQWTVVGLHQKTRHDVASDHVRFCSHCTFAAGMVDWRRVSPSEVSGRSHRAKSLWGHMESRHKQEISFRSTKQQRLEGEGKVFV